jgi:hypothetical protein
MIFIKKKSKLAIDLKAELWSDFNNMTSTQWTNVDTLRKLRKYKKLEDKCKQMFEHLTWHFKIQNNSTENPYYKIDSLVWQFIFNERIPRYDERVYRLSAYLVNNYYNLQSKSLADIVNFDFDITMIPKNYKNIILKYNPPLNEQEYLKEKGSKYEIKKYHYFYFNKEDKKEENMSKTYVRFNLYERFNNLIANVSSIDDPSSWQYDESKDEEIGKQLEKEYKIIANSKSNLTVLFWKIGIMKNLFNKLEKEEQERLKDISNTNILKHLPNKNLTRFSETAILNPEIKEKLHKFRKNLFLNKKKFLKPNYHVYEERVLISPELNISTKLKKRKPLADRLFNL